MRFNLVKIAVLLKQVPSVSELKLGKDGRLIRDLGFTEINPYCRRALSKGLELAREYNGTTTAFTLGPPNASNVLVEALTAGVTQAVHICDPLFSGSDTLATASILARAIQESNKFDLILMGRSAIDSDTAQVGPQLAELLQIPFLFSAREISLRGDYAFASLEDDFGYRDVICDLPIVVSCAERLCEPTKISSADWDDTAKERIIIRSAVDLHLDGPNTVHSMTTVINVSEYATARAYRRLVGSSEEIGNTLAAILLDRGALDSITGQRDPHETVHAESKNGHTNYRNIDQTALKQNMDSPLASTTQLPPNNNIVDQIIVVIDAADFEHGDEVLHLADKLAAQLSCKTTAIIFGNVSRQTLLSLATNKVLCIRPEIQEDQASDILSQLLGDQAIRAVIAHSTPYTREILARFAAKKKFGMIGDVIGAFIENNRIIGLKPAFAGMTVAHVIAESTTTVMTTRLLDQVPRLSKLVPKQITYFDPESNSPVQTLQRRVLDSIGALDQAKIIVGIGAGVDPADYGLLDPIIDLLSAKIGATRRVTDRGLFPRSRQIGITGVFVSADLCLALGISGKLNHMIGVSRTKTIVAINPDPMAPIFEACDIAIVADYRAVLGQVTTALARVIDEDKLKLGSNIQNSVTE